MVDPDDVLVVAAAHRLKLIRTDQWPMVAAVLVAEGFEGDALVEVAALSRSASGWQLDQLVPRLLNELGAPELEVEQAGDIAARLLARSIGGPDHPVIRALAPLAPSLDYPGGRIGQAYHLSEWLDCECHEGSTERAEADQFEDELRGLPPLQIPAALAEALTR